MLDKTSSNHRFYVENINENKQMFDERFQHQLYEYNKNTFLWPHVVF